MIRIETNIEIKQSPERVFSYSLDVREWPRWMGDELEVKKTSDGQIGIGATFRGAIKGRGPQWALTGKLTDYEPIRKCGYVIDSESCHIEAEVTYDSIETGTRLQLAYDFQGYGFLRLLDFFLKSVMQKRTYQSLNSLKSILESSTVVISR